MKFVKGMSKETREKVKIIMSEGERFSFYREGPDQISIYYFPRAEPNGVLGFVFSEVNEVSESFRGVHRADFLKLFDEPIRLTRSNFQPKEIEFMTDLLSDIMSGRYPSNKQLSKLETIGSNPDSILTQAILRGCHEGGIWRDKGICFCPVALTNIGCPLTGNVEVSPDGYQAFSFEQRPKQIAQSKPFQHLLKAILKEKDYSELSADIREVLEESIRLGD